MSKSSMAATTTTSSLAVASMTPSTTELHSFYSTLSKVGKPVILSLVPGFCEAYVPLQLKGVLPSPLSK